MKIFNNIFSAIFSSKLDLLILLLSAVLVPFFILSFYAHPAIDDYDYAYSVLKYKLPGMQAEWYTKHNGRYFSTFVISSYLLFTNTLGIFFRSYRFIPMLLSVLLLSSLYYFIKMASCGGISKKGSASAALAVFVLYLCFCPALAEGFYWLCGGVTYQAGISLMLLLSGALMAGIRQAGMGKRLLYALACSLLAVCAVGTNETVMVVLLITASVGTAWSLLGKRPGAIIWIPVLATTAACSYFVLNSPGNTLRTGLYPGSRDLFKASFHALHYTVFYLVSFVSNVSVLCAGLLALVLSKEIYPRIAVFRNIGKKGFFLLFTLWIVLIYSATWSSLWATAQPPRPRVVNTIYFIFLLGWLSNFILVGGLWLENSAPEDTASKYLAGLSIFAGLLLLVSYGDINKLKAAVTDKKDLSIYMGMLAAAAYVVLASLKSRSIRMREYLIVIPMLLLIAGIVLKGNFVISAFDLLGPAGSYDRQMKSRYAILRKDAKEGKRGSVVPALRNVPKSIYFADITDDPDSWANQELALYFGLESVAVSSGPGK